MARSTEYHLGLVQPSRPVLTDAFVKAFIPFSHTPARDVLVQLSEDVKDATALFLGCADGSCLLASLAACHPGLVNLTAVLNDSNPVMLARAAMILLMCAELDPDSQDDMIALWEVWYCTLWCRYTQTRARPFIERLQQGSVPWLVIPDAADQETLCRIWKRWLSKDRPSATKLLRLRKDFKTTVLDAVDAMRAEMLSYLEAAVYMTVKMDSIELAEQAVKKSVPRGQFVTLQGVLQQDLKTWYDTGNMAPNYRGQSQANETQTANVTLISHADGAWRCKIFTSPAKCWGPFSAAELQSALSSGSPAGLTARVCIARITQLVRGLQHHTQMGRGAVGGMQDQSHSHRTHVQVQLVCMDAKQLCLGVPLRGSTGSTRVTQPQQKREKGKATTEALVSRVAGQTALLLFDVIETGTIADNSSLLPVLVSAGARLKPVPHARLYVGVKDWMAWGSTLKDYMTNKALCMPLTLTYTILGLRLLTDLEPDRPETPNTQEYTYRVDGYRELVWAPVPAGGATGAHMQPYLTAMLLGGPEGSIEAVLQAIATQLCCRTDLKLTSDPQNCTPQLLAWLLASLSQRADMSALVGDGFGGSGGTETDVQTRYAAAQRVLWAIRRKVTPRLPPHFRLCFTTGLDILRSSLQQNAPQEWLPAGVPPCPGVCEALSDWGVSEAGMGQSEGFRLVVIEKQKPRKGSHSGRGSTQTAASTDMDSWALRGVGRVPKGVHITDVWSSQIRGENIQPGTVAPLSLYLPLDHGLAPDQTCIMVAGADKDTQTRLKQHGIVQSPPTLAQVLLPAACPCAAAQYTGSHAEQQLDSHTAQREATQRETTQAQGETTIQREINHAQRDTTAQRETTTQQESTQATRETTAQRETTKPWELRVIGVHETASHYRIVMQLVSATTGRVPTASDRLNPEYMRTPWAQVGHKVHGGGPRHDTANHPEFPTTQTIRVGLSQPEGQVQPAEFHTPWPVTVGIGPDDAVAAGAYCMDIQHMVDINIKKWQLEFKVTKAEAWEQWPTDEACHASPAPLHLAQLAPLCKAAEQVMERCNISHFLADEVGLMSHHAESLSKYTPWVRLRHLLGNLMDAVAPTNLPPRIGAPVCFTVCGWLKNKSGRTVGRGDSMAFATLCLRLHLPLLVTAAGRPVLPVTVVDVSQCETAVEKGIITQREVDTLLASLGVTRASLVNDKSEDELGKFKRDGGAQWKVHCLLPECQVLRRILFRKALASTPTPAQRACLPKGDHLPYWWNTYLSYLQCPGMSYVKEGPVGPGDSPFGQPTGPDSYLHHRIGEVMIESCDFNKSHEEKQAIARELGQLLEQNAVKQVLAPHMLKAAETILAKLQKHKPSGQGSSSVCSDEEEDVTDKMRSLQVGGDQQASVHSASGYGTYHASSSSGGDGSSGVTNRAGQQQAADRCAACGKSGEELLRCGKCKVARYCSRECQVAHWKQHKLVCRAA